MSPDIIDGILAERLRPLDEGLSEANLFNFLGTDVVLSDVRNPVFWSHQLVDLHIPECTSVEVSRQ